MPFVNRFVSPIAPPLGSFGLLRNHPVIVASGAAAAGVLLGAFVAVQVLATPEKTAAGAALPQAAAEPRPAPPIAETTGSARVAEPARSDVSAGGCDEQTWPDLTRGCMKNGGARVDDFPARHDVARSAAPPVQPVAAASDPPATASRAPAPVAAAAAQPDQAAAKPQPKQKPKRVARKYQHKPAKREYDGDGSNAYARDDRRYDRARRVVQRYDRRDADDGDRRVTVIRRGGGDLFGGLFGNAGTD